MRGKGLVVNVLIAKGERAVGVLYIMLTVRKILIPSREAEMICFCTIFFEYFSILVYGVGGRESRFFLPLRVLIRRKNLNVFVIVSELFLDNINTGYFL